MRKPKKQRKPTPEQLADLAALGRKYADATLDPEFIEIKKTCSIPEIVEAMKAYKKKKPKRPTGRPPIANKFEILDACALAKVRDGRYLPVATRFKLETKQLTDLVQHNRAYFDAKVKSLRKTLSIKA